MRRRIVLLVPATLAFLLVGGPAWACGGLVNANGSVTLVRTTTLAAYHLGVEHYVTSFEFAGVGGEFGSIVPLPGVPFNESWAVILNEKGRVLDPGTKRPMVGEYTGGWIKRGPSGVIGTNKPDAAETVACMVEDLAQGLTLHPAAPGAEAAERLIRERQPRFFSFQDWLRLNELEVGRGRAMGRPRVKFTRVEEMLQALGR